jgi:hypothetical protein
VSGRATGPGVRPERRTWDGAVLLTHNHIAVLQGLLDRPGGRAPSKRDLVAAALPYVCRYRRGVAYPAGIAHSIARLPSSLVHWRREGNRKVFTLRPRGRAILDGKLPARIRGIGPYVPGRVAP